VVCATVRKTLGWHKEIDLISLSQYRTLTGIGGKSTLTNALKDAVSQEFLIKYPGSTNGYGINREYEIASPKIGLSTSPEIVPVPSPKTGDTKDTFFKETLKPFGDEFMENYQRALIMGILSSLHEIWYEQIPHAPGWKLTTPKYLKKLTTRLKEEEFRTNLGEILRSIIWNTELQKKGWFDFGWLIHNDEQYMKIKRGKYSWFMDEIEKKEKEISPTHHTRLPSSAPNLPAVMTPQQIQEITG